MNKGRRHELKMLKYKKRIIKYGLLNKEGKFYAFRSHGTPCSCGVCKNQKYRETGRHSDELVNVEIDNHNEIRNANLEYFSESYISSCGYIGLRHSIFI